MIGALLELRWTMIGFSRANGATHAHRIVFLISYLQLAHVSKCACTAQRLPAVSPSICYSFTVTRPRASISTHLGGS